MSDLIDRQAVLDLVATDKPQLLDSDALYMAIEDLPSAESDVPDTNVGNMISRQDAIDAMAEALIEFPIGLTEAYELAEDALSGLPSAEPERKKGKWIWQTENRYVCSECGHHAQVDELFEEPMYAFCPYCSTSMLDEDGNVRYER